MILYHKPTVTAYLVFISGVTVAGLVVYALSIACMFAGIWFLITNIIRGLHL